MLFSFQVGGDDDRIRKRTTQGIYTRVACFGSIASVRPTADHFRCSPNCGHHASGPPLPKGVSVTLQSDSVGTNEVDGGVTRTSTWRFASMAFQQELECRLAKGPRRLQTQGMRGVGKDDLLYVREIAR